MKKIFSTALFLAIATCVFAQTHLSFEGVSMGNTVSEFSKQLKSKGFNVEKEDSTIILATGLYMGDTMSIFVHGLNAIPHYVSSVSVMVNSLDNKTCNCETMIEKIKYKLGKDTKYDFRSNTFSLSSGEISILCKGVDLLNITYKDKINDNQSLYEYISRKGGEKQNDASLHITFKGIPVMGTVNDFCNKLSSSGFNLVKMYNDGAMAAMNGDFADRPSTLYIIGTKKSHFVQGIIVDFDRVYNKWQTIKNDYKTIIEQYIVKYGNPYSVDESFDYPYEEGDGYEMLALKLNKCNYRTTFKLTKGNIVISLREDATIAILYSDTENATLGDYENNSKIQSDI